MFCIYGWPNYSLAACCVSTHSVCERKLDAYVCEKWKSYFVLHAHRWVLIFARAVWFHWKGPCQRSQLYGDERVREWVDTGRDEWGPGGCWLRMLEVALGRLPAAVCCGKSFLECPQLQRLNLHFKTWSGLCTGGPWLYGLCGYIIIASSGVKVTATLLKSWRTPLWFEAFTSGR